MDALDTIYTRRSIRKFTNKRISDEQITKLLKAGMQAPTSGNQRPWQFIVVKESEMIEKFIDAYPYAKMLRGGPVGIMVCFDKDFEKYEARWQMDCATTTLNILLAAHSMGLGCVWLEIYPVDERIPKVQHSFGIPKSVIPFALIGIGHPDEQKSPEDRYEESRVHYERW